METESWITLCFEIIKKWWEIMSNLQSDLNELRSLQLDTPSLSADSRSVRYESNYPITKINGTNNDNASTVLNINYKKCIEHQANRRHSWDKGVRIKSIIKRTNECYRKKYSGESSKFNYIPPEPYPKYPAGIYKALKAGLGIYDLLALTHIVPAPWDHALKPPYYPPLPVPTVVKFGVIDMD